MWTNMPSRRRQRTSIHRCCNFLVISYCLGFPRKSTHMDRSPQRRTYVTYVCVRREIFVRTYARACTPSTSTWQVWKGIHWWQVGCGRQPACFRPRPAGRVFFSEEGVDEGREQGLKAGSRYFRALLEKLCVCAFSYCRSFASCTAKILHMYTVYIEDGFFLLALPQVRPWSCHQVRL
ncbi:unnamed protein product, partial [Ectocarpus sp. 6 AP-2014]